MSKYERIGEIQAELKKRQGLTQKEFGEALGFKQPQNYSNFKKLTKGNFEDDKLEALIYNYNVNLNWIYTNKGEMFLDTPTDDHIEEAQSAVVEYLENKIKSLESKILKLENDLKAKKLK